MLYARRRRGCVLLAVVGSLNTGSRQWAKPEHVRAQGRGADKLTDAHANRLAVEGAETISHRASGGRLGARRVLRHSLVHQLIKGDAKKLKVSNILSLKTYLASLRHRSHEGLTSLRVEMVGGAAGAVGLEGLL